MLGQHDLLLTVLSHILYLVYDSYDRDSYNFERYSGQQPFLQLVGLWPTKLFYLADFVISGLLSVP